MKLKLKPLNEIFATFDEKEFLQFLDSYDTEACTNPFIYKCLNKKLRNKEIIYEKDEKACQQFFDKNKETLEKIDKLEENTKILLGSSMKMLYIVYKNLDEDIKEYQEKTQELEILGIDNIVFGFNPLKRKIGPIIVSKNLKTYIKKENEKKLDQLKIFSNGLIEKANIIIDKKNDNNLLSCVFDLNNPTFVLEANKANTLYLLGTEIDLENIKKIGNLENNDFEFNEEIESFFQKTNLQNYNYHLEIAYPSLIGQNPKKLYKER